MYDDHDGTFALGVWYYRHDNEDIIYVFPHERLLEVETSAIIPSNNDSKIYYDSYHNVCVCVVCFLNVPATTTIQLLQKLHRKVVDNPCYVIILPHTIFGCASSNIDFFFIFFFMYCLSTKRGFYGLDTRLEKKKVWHVIITLLRISLIFFFYLIFLKGCFVVVVVFVGCFNLIFVQRIGFFFRLIKY